jgi:hypothetical protein
MKEIECICCGRTESVPDEMPEKGYLCDECQENHQKNAAADHELEFELSQEVEA